MRTYQVAAAAAAVLAIGTQASAVEPPSAPLKHDLQCMIATSMLAQSADEQTKSAGQMASLYYAGKVFGASPTINLEEAMEAEADRMKDADVQALLKECGQELQTRGDQMQKAGDALSAKGK